MILYTLQYTFPSEFHNLCPARRQKHRSVSSEEQSDVATVDLLLVDGVHPQIT